MSERRSQCLDTWWCLHYGALCEMRTGENTSLSSSPTTNSRHLSSRATPLSLSHHHTYKLNWIYTKIISFLFFKIIVLWMYIVCEWYFGFSSVVISAVLWDWFQHFVWWCSSNMLMRIFLALLFSYSVIYISTVKKSTFSSPPWSQCN